MGIALPKTIVEGRNRMYVLGAYALIFGAGLPALVGRWWFGNREKTKDGVNARSAAAFFKNLSEDSGIDEVVATLGRSFEWERPNSSKNASELQELEQQIEKVLGSKWGSLKTLAEVIPKQYPARRRAFILLYAHLLRLPIASPSLRHGEILEGLRCYLPADVLATEQSELILHTPTLLNSLLNIITSRNWLVPTLAAMRLHAYLAQALLPGDTSLKLAQLPGIRETESRELLSSAVTVSNVAEKLEEKGDSRASEVRKAMSQWGKIEIVDASFKGMLACLDLRGEYANDGQSDRRAYMRAPLDSLPRRQASCRTPLKFTEGAKGQQKCGSRRFDRRRIFGWS